MSTTGILRSRRSAAQRHALVSVVRKIGAIDPTAGCKYLRDFREAYRSYQKVLALTDVRHEIAQAGIVLVGDYHALPNSQRYLASLLRDPELHQRPVVLGVETIFSPDQHILGEWVRGELDEHELRQRIRLGLRIPSRAPASPRPAPGAASRRTHAHRSAKRRRPLLARRWRDS